MAEDYHWTAAQVLELTFPQLRIYTTDRDKLKSSRAQFKSEQAMERYQEKKKAERQQFADEFLRRVNGD